MQLELTKLKSHLARGPLIEFFEDGKVIKMEQKVPMHVDEKYAYQLLEKYPDLIRRIPRTAVAKPKSKEKRIKGLTKNKMVSKYRDKVDAIRLEENEDGPELERPSI